MEAPANVVRAIAGAPAGYLRNSLLASLGYDSELDRVSGERQREGKAEVEAWYNEHFTEREELAW